jgi:hypothetical protein
MTLKFDTSPPTPAEIDAEIEDLIAVELGAARPEHDFADYWECCAYDQNGEQQGIGYDLTPATAKAAAWVTACGWLNPIPTWELRGISRTVPAGWTFEVTQTPDGQRGRVVWRSSIYKEPKKS